MIPLVVSIDEKLKFFLSSSQINLILFEESRIAFFKSSETEFSDLFISAALTLKDFIFGSFNSSLIMLRASVPFLIIKSLYRKSVFSISLELIVEDFQLIGNFDFDLFIKMIELHESIITWVILNYWIRQYRRPIMFKATTFSIG